MSVEMIRERLQAYRCKTELEERQAIREITQEVVLAGLGRGDFFKHALFQGGTCLRIFHGLNRFSEDLDFLLRDTDPGFRLKDHLRHLADELAAYGYAVEITDRGEADAVVKKAFIKDNSIGKVIDLRHPPRSGTAAKIRIKLEVDTHPPSGGGHEPRYLDFPFVMSVPVQDTRSLFAGKLHALLCRPYVKGRDWYDFLWYTSNRIDVNYAFLASALQQSGPWRGRSIPVNHAWLLDELKRKITSMDWARVADDVRHFVRVGEQPSLAYWGKDLFLAQCSRIPAHADGTP